jgi:mannose-1-phosphate guanylyltransferase
MKPQDHPYSHARGAIILAGGDGARLRSFTRAVLRRDAPKQFCRLVGSRTLLEQTIQRASLVAEAGTTFTVVNRAHESLYLPLLTSHSSRRIIAQPANRGTAPAILYALLHLAKIDANAPVIILPSDHYFDDEAALAGHADAAFEAVEKRPELTILLGVTPSSAEPSYGWIEPGARLGTFRLKEVHAVGRFIEKPVPSFAAQLMASGCLWNTFIMVGRVSTMLSLFLVAAPDLYSVFAKTSNAFDTVREQAAIERLYGRLPVINFSKDVLEQARTNLAVLPVTGIHWSDLGEPARVLEVIERLAVRAQGNAA